jgi:Type ISP C-terminal specificity domain
VQDVAAEIRQIAYRPFDTRWIFYHPSLVWGRAYPTMRHALDGSNLMLAVSRQLHDRSDPWCHAFVCTAIGESGFVSNRSKEVTTFFPTLLTDGNATMFPGATPNVSADFVSRAERAGVIPRHGSEEAEEAVAAYIYAILHSPTYRSMYHEALVREFPRIPLPARSELARGLQSLGRRLIDTHLLRSLVPGRSEVTYVGQPAPTVGRVTWSEDTVWLDAATGPSHSVPDPGARFQGVPEHVWNWRVGAYRVCEKWLKDRKGQGLSADDIAHYQKIVVALTETIRLMKEIDEVIEQHGGWPGAFALVTDDEPLRLPR